MFPQKAAVAIIYSVWTRHPILIREYFSTNLLLIPVEVSGWTIPLPAVLTTLLLQWLLPVLIISDFILWIKIPTFIIYVPIHLFLFLILIIPVWIQLYHQPLHNAAARQTGQITKKHCGSTIGSWSSWIMIIHWNILQQKVLWHGDWVPARLMKVLIQDYWQQQALKMQKQEIPMMVIHGMPWSLTESGIRWIAPGMILMISGIILTSPGCILVFLMSLWLLHIPDIVKFIPKVVIVPVPQVWQTIILSDQEMLNSGPKPILPESRKIWMPEKPHLPLLLIMPLIRQVYPASRTELLLMR